MGVLSGLTVVELAGLGPAPFAAMMLADHGARVIRIDRPDGADGSGNVLCRNRSSLALDLKQAQGRDVLLKLIDSADILIEPFRPGVMERLGLGPAECLARNPRLVYGRMTGWGQDGPLANAAGHDINYVSLVGVTDAVGRPGERPVPPLNLVGDYGGGGMLLAFGVLAAVLSAQRTGIGQVIDAAMVDGASILMAEYWGFLGRGEFEGPRGTHLLDGGAPFYRVYETSDKLFVSIGPLERKFFDDLLTRIGLNPSDWVEQNDPLLWPDLEQKFEEIFRTRTRAEWTTILEGTDTCFAPVLTMDEAKQHPHVLARKTLCDVSGMTQPSPAPRFAQTPAATPTLGSQPGQHTKEILTKLGYSPSEVEMLLATGAARQP